MAQGVDLNGKGNGETFFFTHGNTSIQDGFPILIPGKVIVGDKKSPDALRQVSPNESLYIIG